MKAKIYLLLFFLLGSLIVSCKKDLAYKNKYEDSYHAWLKFKKASGNSYRYLVATGSWTGAFSDMVITVKNGIVVQRDFTSGNIDPETHQRILRETWTEGEDEINTHEGYAPAMTLDEVYHKAKTDWLKKRDHADTYFEAANQGMISSCGYVEKGCQDDCFIGISISYIRGI